MAREENLIRRTFRTTIWVSFVGVVGLGARGYDWPIYGGYAAGVALGLGSLRLLEATAARAMRAREGRLAGLVVGGATVVKIPALLGIVYLLSVYARFNPIAVVVGICMPAAVIVLKIAGAAIRFGRPAPGDKGAGAAEEKVNKQTRRAGDGC